MGETTMDLSTRYLGLNLRTPLVPSASPICDDIDNIKRMEDAGAAAIVLHSLFEEQLTREQDVVKHHLMFGTESFPEALTYLPQPEEFHMGPDEYPDHIRKAKEAVHIPIIASLNGASIGGWIDYARKIQQAGADALELNVYYIPTALDRDGVEIEQTYIDILKAVKEVVSIPVAIKLSPFFSNMANMAKQLDQAGANALVLFNRFYQPDIDLDSLEVRANMNQHASGHEVAFALDCYPVWAPEGRSGGHRRPSHRSGCNQNADGRRGCHHDLLGASGARDRCDTRNRSRHL